VDDFFHE
jgi:hypothetical protein